VFCVLSDVGAIYINRKTRPILQDFPKMINISTFAPKSKIGAFLQQIEVFYLFSYFSPKSITGNLGLPTYLPTYLSIGTCVIRPIYRRAAPHGPPCTPPPPTRAGRSATPTPIFLFHFFILFPDQPSSLKTLSRFI
jgi:hypothetical protein